MRRQQTGFTLIELVMVIVIIGILAAVAIPKFIDLSGEADQAAVNGVAGGLSSASAVNYAAKKAGNASAVALTDCNGAGGLLQGGLPGGYTITAAALTADTTTSCTVTGQGSKTATFTATGT